MRRIARLVGRLALVHLLTACGSDDSFIVGGSSDAGPPGASADATVLADAASTTPDAARADASLDAGLADAGPSDGGCVEGQVIETGNDIRSVCNTLQVCQGGALVQTQAADAGPDCPTPLAADTAGCPGSAAAALHAGACTVGLDCNFGDAYCTCTTLVDGGSGFYCLNPGVGCPARRPLLGSACSVDGGGGRRVLVHGLRVDLAGERSRGLRGWRLAGGRLGHHLQSLRAAPGLR